jgi:hypothetical protein
MIYYVFLVVAGPIFGLLTAPFNAVRDYRKRRRVEMHRVERFPAILRRVEPALQREPWPTRQTPTDLAAAYETGDARVNASPILSERRTDLDPTDPDGELVPARASLHIQATVDDHGCPMPCTAKHCIHHARITGTINQRFRWNTDTAEWSLLGLRVPDFPPLRSEVFFEGAT